MECNQHKNIKDTYINVHYILIRINLFYPKYVFIQEIIYLYFTIIFIFVKYKSIDL